ncbi:MAG: hypothetical protein M1840_000156 [Geoglossum simile]|nr:MAG: hypothetical protein M1840_000156 [Geoglossum simile]
MWLMIHIIALNYNYNHPMLKIVIDIQIEAGIKDDLLMVRLDALFVLRNNAKILEKLTVTALHYSRDSPETAISVETSHSTAPASRMGTHAVEYNLEELREHIYGIRRQRESALLLLYSSFFFFIEAADSLICGATIPTIVRFGNDLSPYYEAILHTAPIVGTVIGLVGCGIVADMHTHLTLQQGAVKLGLLALWTTTCIVESPTKATSWFVFWHLVMRTIGGASYVLIAAITSEMRSRFLKHTAIFIASFLGYLSATFVEISLTNVRPKFERAGMSVIIPTLQSTPRDDVEIRQRALDNFSIWIMSFSLIATVYHYFYFRVMWYSRPTLDVVGSLSFVEKRRFSWPYHLTKLSEYFERGEWRFPCDVLLSRFLSEFALYGTLVHFLIFNNRLLTSHRSRPQYQDALRLVLSFTGCSIWISLRIRRYNTRQNKIRTSKQSWPSLVPFWIMLTLFAFQYDAQSRLGVFAESLGASNLVSRVLFDAGVNLTIFSIPVQLFPPQFRYTLYGICAASGKIVAAIVQNLLGSRRLRNPQTVRTLTEDSGLIVSFFALMAADVLTSRLTDSMVWQPDGDDGADGDGKSFFRSTPWNLVPRPGFVDQIKLAIETKLQYPVIWWPLEQPISSCPRYHERVSWFCDCGSELYVDLPEYMAREIITWIAPTPAPILPTTANPIAPSAPKGSQGGIGMSISSGARQPFSWLNSGSIRSKPAAQVAQQAWTDQGVANDRYVHWCVDRNRYETQLVHIPILSLNDRNFIKKLRSAYYATHNFRRWFSLTSCYGVKFVMFQLIQPEKDLVACGKEELPDPLSEEYVYKYFDPREQFVKTLEKTLMHHFHNHHGCSADDAQHILERIPKKANGKLKTCYAADGYGMHAVPGWAVWKIVALFAVSQICPLAYAIRWLCGHAGDLQNAFVLSMYLVGVFNILLIFPNLFTMQR